MRTVKLIVDDDFDPETHKIVCEVERSQGTAYSYLDKTELSIWQPQYRELLDKGFIGLVDFMGDDYTVTSAARVSYGKGTKRLSEDRNLIRYLMRHHHSTPFEMVEIMFHVKAPIFVFRQWHRHRAGVSINEYSARYSVMSDDMYMPDASVMKPQSSTNKQGRDGVLSDKNIEACQLQLQSIYAQCAQAYRYLLGMTDVPDDSLNHRFTLIKEFALEKIKALQESHQDWTPEKVTDQMIDEKIKEIEAASGLTFTDEDFWSEPDHGLCRELARIALPMSTYSEMYWKCDLRNIFNFISLRSDPHAQEEIRVYSNAMLEMIEPIAPICVAAFVDYQQKGVKFSAMEVDVIKTLYENAIKGSPDTMPGVIEDMLSKRGAGKREISEFFTRMAGVD